MKYLVRLTLYKEKKETCMKHSTGVSCTDHVPYTCTRPTRAVLIVAWTTAPKSQVSFPTKPRDSSAATPLYPASNLYGLSCMQIRRHADVHALRLKIIRGHAWCSHGDSLRGNDSHGVEHRHFPYTEHTKTLRQGLKVFPWLASALSRGTELFLEEH